MTTDFNELERRRLVLQASLDGGKTASERNKLGQFSTPPALAHEILRQAATLLPASEPVHFLDPALGTGAFFSALCSTLPKHRVAEAVGFEVDPHYGYPAKELWEANGLCVNIGDFTAQPADPLFNLIICNPPYVRHHHLTAENKVKLQGRIADSFGVGISGLAGLYCYFVGISHQWMAPNAIAGWLIPSEFMDVNYGKSLKHYLLDKVTLLRIHRFDPNDVQFADALVSSVVVWLQNTPPPADHHVAFSFGGTLSAPVVNRMMSVKELVKEHKWTRFPKGETRSNSMAPTLSDFFKIKRGLATGDNNFFILSEEEIRKRGLPMQVFRPILPSPRYLSEDEIDADLEGNPQIDRRLYLLDIRLNEKEVESQYPVLWRYLEEGRAAGLPERYLCAHRPIWYTQENRPPPPIVCTYLGRSDNKNGRPFRFILNRSLATISNVYLALYPIPQLENAIRQDRDLTRRVWEFLNQITSDDLLGEGRVYGGGLHKLEPKELANVPASAIADLLNQSGIFHHRTQTLEFAFP